MTLTELLWVTEGLAIVAVAIAWRGRFVVPAAIVLSLTILVLHGYVFWDHVADDAFISFRYARNLADGHGPVWNPGEHVEGYTNFSWVVLLAGASAAGADIVEASRWLGFASVAGLLVVLLLLARELTADERQAELVFAGAALLFVATAPAAYWAFGGLEEPLFTFVVALALWLHIREERTDDWRPWSAGAAAAAILTRPEGPLIAGIIFVFKAVRLLTRTRDRNHATSLLVWSAVVIVPWAAFVGWRLWYYDSLFPNTYYQKLDGRGLLNADRYHEGLTYLSGFWKRYGTVLVFPMPYAVLLVANARKAAAPILTFMTLWIVYIIYVGGDFFAFFRFLVPILPLAYLLSVQVTLTAVRRVVVPEFRRPAAAVLPLMLMAAIAWLMHVPEPEVKNIRFWSLISAQRAEIAAWIRTQDPDVYVAVNAAGEIPYWSGVRSLDTLGLNDRHIARQPPFSASDSPYNAVIPGHMKGDGRYVLERKPDIIIVTAGVYLLPETEKAWKERTRLLPADRDLLRQPDVWDLYEPAWVKLPSGSIFNFLRLKESTKVEANRSPSGQ